jgi:4-alpha-glucanotransferase
VKHPSLDDRASGILAHLSSLPGSRGGGDLGEPARAFVDFLARSGQRWWQMLPVGPPGYGESPYSAQSAFAGDPAFVSTTDLGTEGGIDAAYDAWRARGNDPKHARFCRQAASWLDDFALFRALKRAHGGVQWTLWEHGVKKRVPRALDAARKELARDIAVEKFAQYAFDAQWSALRKYAKGRGVGLIGDIPLVVAHDSADVWQRPELFFLDSEGEPAWVAGVPPDYFSATGQRWGNPIYRWDRMKKDRYAWWTARLRLMLRRFDAIRLDHFIGFTRFWRVAADRPDAIVGRWIKGPGADFFSAVQKALGDLPLIAEDLGVVAPDVFALRDRFGFPGIKVLQFAFGTDPYAYTFLPHNYPRNAVVYTGTHDNDTTVGWFRDAGGGWSTRTPAETEAEREKALAYLGTTGQEIHWDMIRAALGSVANVAIVPLQDVLGLGSESRMNRPGKESGNWTWRFAANALTPSIERRLATLTRTYGRG